MATVIYIYSTRSLKEPRGGLEDDLEDAFGDVLEVTGGGGGIRGWNIDLELADDETLEHVLPRLVRFLREWGVPEDTYLNIYPPDWEEGQEPRRVDVFSEPADPSRANASKP
jgi:hypothetical protein